VTLLKQKIPKAVQMTDIAVVVKALQQGNIIVYPTDTLYGLGADIFNEQAVKKIFSIKKRPLTAPLSIAVPDINWVEKLAITNATAMTLAKKFLPGPLTLVLKKQPVISDLLTAGGKTIAIRIPADSLALKLLSAFGPLTATSANIHGYKAQHSIKNIQMQFKDVDIAYYLDDGERNGLPSTLVDATSDNIVVLREGQISHRELEEVLQHG
jgi:L-threonylcarbamoyladenylate synthase